jgi:protein involved in polysaccharide export with SLBB domain
MRFPLKTGLWPCLSLLVLLATQSSVMHAQVVTSASATTSSPSSDSLRPGDIIRLRIWREPDLSGDFVVDDRGEVVLPKLGVIRLADQSLDSLRTTLFNQYSRYLTQTSIEVTVLHRIQVLGAVKNPGLYPVDGTMAVADAIALAGGIVVDGNSKQVQLIRDGQKITAKLSPDARIGQMAMRSGDQLYVPFRSWLSRNGYLAGTLLSAAVTAIAILHRN